MPSKPPSGAHGWHFLLGLVVGSVVAIVVWTIVVLGASGRALQGSLWVDATTAKKRASAETIPVPKIAIIAGSNALFGIRSSLLQETYDRPVINLAVNAGLLLPLILDQSKPSLRDGDIVLMPLEYPLYNYHGEINQVLIDYLLSRRDLLRQQPFGTVAQIIAEVPLWRLLDGYRGLPSNFKLTGLYGPHRIDSFGDQINTATSQRTAVEYAEAQASSIKQYGHEAISTARGWTLLRAFHSWADQRNICIILVPPAFMRRSFYTDDPIERSFYEKIPEIARKNGLTYLGAPLQEMLPPAMFFNTDYHLTDEARTYFTQRLIRLLGPNLANHCQAH